MIQKGNALYFISGKLSQSQEVLILSNFLFSPGHLESLIRWGRIKTPTVLSGRHLPEKKEHLVTRRNYIHSSTDCSKGRLSLQKNISVIPMS